MNYILFDVAIVAVLLFTCWSGFRKGFVLTLCGFLAFFVAVIGAHILSSSLAEPAADVFLPVVEDGIYEILDSHDISFELEDLLPSGALEDLDLPLDDTIALLKDSPIYRTVADTFLNALEDGTVEITTNVTQALIRFIAVQLARVVLFLAFFMLIQIVWLLLSHALDLAFKLPVLSTLNAVSGAALGLLKGLIFVFIAVWLLKNTFLPAEALEECSLLPFFAAGPLQALSMISQ